MLESCLFGCVLSVFLSGNFLVIFLPFSIGIKHWGRTDCPSGVALLLLEISPSSCASKVLSYQDDYGNAHSFIPSTGKKKIRFHSRRQQCGHGRTNRQETRVEGRETKEENKDKPGLLLIVQWHVRIFQ